MLKLARIETALEKGEVWDIWDDWVPVDTLVGMKRVPTVEPPTGKAPGSGWSVCETCPVRAECLSDVLRGDFAWCEKVIPADLGSVN